MKFRLFNRRSQSLGEARYLNDSDNTSVSLRASVISGDDVEKIDLKEAMSECDFDMDLKYWERETASMSANNYDNTHFESIVEMGEEAVPYIFKKLQEGPTPLVHALELIYPEKIKYKGFVSLSQARRIWLRILRKQIGS